MKKNLKVLAQKFEMSPVLYSKLPCVFECIYGFLFVLSINISAIKKTLFIGILHVSLAFTLAPPSPTQTFHKEFSIL